VVDEGFTDFVAYTVRAKALTCDGEAIRRNINL